MAKKKDENPFTPSAAEVVKPAELVAENIPPAKTPEITTPDDGGNSNGSDMAGGEKAGSAENAPSINPPEIPQPVATAPTAPAVTVTAEQLVSENIPANPLPPVPGQPKRGRGRPSIPHPECKKCGRKHKPGPCLTENGASQINIVDGPQPGNGEAPDTSEAIDEKPAVNYRQLAEVCFDLSTNTAGAIIGPEWRAQDEKEREGMLIPLEMYLRSQEVKDIPPGAILCFAIAGYATARFRVPNTRTKFALGWAWLKSKMPGKRRSFVPKVVNGSDNPFAEKN